MTTKGYENADWEALGPCTLEIEPDDEFVHETLLVDSPSPVSYAICCPDEPAYWDLAYRLQEAIAGTLDTRDRVWAAGVFDRAMNKAGASGPLHIVALGNMGNNPLLVEQYHVGTVAVDGRLAAFKLPVRPENRG